MRPSKPNWFFAGEAFLPLSYDTIGKIYKLALYTRSPASYSRKQTFIACFHMLRVRRRRRRVTRRAEYRQRLTKNSVCSLRFQRILALVLLWRPSQIPGSLIRLTSRRWHRVQNLVATPLLRADMFHALRHFIYVDSSKTGCAMEFLPQ